ncbi:hypothetical protein KKB28_09975, partial [bacterium]|nr:hypothetical protein [bacterium]
MVRGWADTDEKIAGGLCQPVRHIYIVVPPGTMAVLNVQGLRTHTESGGLAQPPPEWQTVEISRAPEAFVKLVGVFRWRDFRLAHVELYPVREAAGGAALLDEVQCFIEFEGTQTGARIPKDVRVLSRLALNGDIGAAWWEAPPRSRTISNWPDGDIYKLSVRETGLYQVTGTWLQSHGLNIIGRASRDIHLLGNGGRLLPRDRGSLRDSILHENAIYIDDGGDGTFDTDDFFLFFGKALKGYDYIGEEDPYLHDAIHHSPYSRDNTYFIHIDSDGPSGLRMDALPMNGTGGQLVTGTRGHVVRDEDFFIFESSSFSESGLLWYMATVATGESRSFVTSLPGISDGSGNIRFDFKRPGNGNPLLTISLNNSVIRENFYTEQPFDIPLSDALSPGQNALTIENYGTQSTLLNYIEFDYARDLTLSGEEVFIEAPAGATGYYRYELPNVTNAYIADVSDPLRPRMGRGSVFVDSSRADAQRRYYACTSEALQIPQWTGKDVRGTVDYDLLRQNDLQADMIIITPDEWFDNIEPLKTFHETNVEEPLSVMRVKLSDVYDEFGWGNTDPVAIRDFLLYAYNNWRGSSGAEQAPRYLLLVGDGNYDYRGNLA